MFLGKCSLKSFMSWTGHNVALVDWPLLSGRFGFNFEITEQLRDTIYLDNSILQSNSRILTRALA